MPLRYQIEFPPSPPSFDFRFAFQCFVFCSELLRVEDFYCPMRTRVAAASTLTMMEEALLQIIRYSGIDAFTFTEEKIREPHTIKCKNP